MSPAPSRQHQSISGEIFKQLAIFLTGKDCEVYHAPFDVRLPEANEADEKIATVVQSDIAVVCDQNKLDDKGCKGALDFIIEILSPSTASKDFIEKLGLYEKRGVREYWIVDPFSSRVIVWVMRETGKYAAPKFYSDKDEIGVSVLSGLKISLDSIF
jgi:Uma2 family endonuclease